MDYVNNKKNKTLFNQQSINNNDDDIKVKQENNLNKISDSIDNNKQWRNSCELNRQETLIKITDHHVEQAHVSYKVYLSYVI